MNFVFDLDGTLTLPEEGIINSIRFTLAQMGIIETDYQKLLACIGPPLKYAFTNFWNMSPADTEKAVAIYRAYYRENALFQNKLYDGIEELLAHLKSLGHHLYVATSKPQEFAVPILEHFGILQYFDDVAGNTLREERPQKCDVLAYLLQTHPDLNTRNCVMVGDRKHDVEGAAKVGLPCVGVLYGYGDRAELETAGAAEIAGDIKQLTVLLTAWEEKIK